MLFLADAAPAAVIISNLDGNDGTSTSLNTSDRSKAMGFLMGSETLTLDSVVLRLEIADYTITSLEVRLFDNNGSNNPGSELLTFDNPAITANGVANYTFSAPVSYSLQAGEVYWVVARDLGSSTGSRWLASSPAVTPTDPTPSVINATHFGTKFSVGTYPPTGVSSTLASYAVAAVPEPAETALAVGAGLVGLIAARRFRQVGR